MRSGGLTDTDSVQITVNKPDGTPPAGSPPGWACGGAGTAPQIRAPKSLKVRR